MNDYRESGRIFASGIRALGLVRFLPSTNNYDALIAAHYSYFQKYTPDSERMYDRGEVVRDGINKWLLQGDGRLDAAIPLENQSLLKLFRDNGRYEWAREEYVLQGFERSYNGQWYRCIAVREDSATPPPNNPASWELVS